MKVVWFYVGKPIKVPAVCLAMLPFSAHAAMKFVFDLWYRGGLVGMAIRGDVPHDLVYPSIIEQLCSFGMR